MRADGRWGSVAARARNRAGGVGVPCHCVTPFTCCCSLMYIRAELLLQAAEALDQQGGILLSARLVTLPAVHPPTQHTACHLPITPFGHSAIPPLAAVGNNVMQSLDHLLVLVAQRQVKSKLFFEWIEDLMWDLADLGGARSLNALNRIYGRVLNYPLLPRYGGKEMPHDANHLRYSLPGSPSLSTPKLHPLSLTAGLTRPNLT